nr:amidohydrolase family protein [Corynebacterium accolens]
MQRVFDSHLHIIDFSHPIHENQGYTPPEFLVPAYDAWREKLRGEGYNITAGAVVSGSFQGFDQGYLAEALGELDNFVGVTQLPADAPDAEIRRLDGLGVRVVRFNFRRGGSAAREDLEELAWRIYDLAGWHVELYVDAAALGDMAPVLKKLPAVSIDHLGLSEQGVDDLLELVDAGVKVKATGFGRVDLDPGEVVRRIVDVDPTALMAGTDLPSQRASRVFSVDDFRTIGEAAGVHANAVFFANAARFYGRDDAL